MLGMSIASLLRGSLAAPAPMLVPMLCGYIFSFHMSFKYEKSILFILIYYPLINIP